MTYPAPEFLQDDPWFGPAPETERTFAMKQLIQERILEEEIINSEKVEEIVNFKEPENIHEIMYDFATKNVATTLSLNPLPVFGGGSESYQEPWMSGCGPHF